MPLIDTTGRLSTDRCAIQLRDSDNRQLYDFSVIDRNVFANKGALTASAACMNTSSACDINDRDTRAAIDAYLRGDCDSGDSDKDDDTVFLLVPPSMLKEPDSAADCGCTTTNDDAPLNEPMKQQWDGYGVGACAQNIGALRNEKGRTQPRTFIATPNYGAQANRHRVPLNTPDVRRGSRITLTSEDTRYGPQPKKSHSKTTKTFCDTYLRVREVDRYKDVRDNMYECCSDEPSGRIVDRLAEREWDVFDPIIRARDSGDVNILRPCEWIPGGAASRDIARTPEFRRLVNHKF
jgi:hypothetical protein